MWYLCGFIVEAWRVAGCATALVHIIKTRQKTDATYELSAARVSSGFYVCEQCTGVYRENCCPNVFKHSGSQLYPGYQ